MSFSVQDAASLITLVAPGYFVVWTYRRFFPQKALSAGEHLLISTLLSLPIVSVAQAAYPDSDPLSVTFVAVTLGLAGLVGLVAAFLRQTPGLIAVREFLGLHEQPESSIWLAVLRSLDNDDWVTLDFKDGTRLSGVAQLFPGLPDDGVREIYITHPRWYVDGKPVEVAAQGVIVRTDELLAVSLSRDPLRDPV